MSLSDKKSSNSAISLSVNVTFDKLKRVLIINLVSSYEILSLDYLRTVMTIGSSNYLWGVSMNERAWNAILKGSASTWFQVDINSKNSLIFSWLTHSYLFSAFRSLNCLKNSKNEVLWILVSSSLLIVPYIIRSISYGIWGYLF